MRFTTHGFVSGLLAAALMLAGCGGSAPAEGESDSGLRPIRINYPTLSAGSWHLFVTKEGGYYEKYGLDTELVFGLHPQGVAMLVSGEGQMANYSMEQALIAASRDGSFRLIGSPLNKGTFALMASPEFSSVEELAGRRFGISQIGDAPYNYSVAMISQFGLTSRDVEWTPVGTGAAGRAAALLAGRVDATLLTAPTYFALEEEGFALPAVNGDAAAPLTLDSERSLMRELTRYPEIVQTAADNRAPQTLVQYLRDLAAAFHSYYNAERIIVDDEALRNARALLARATQSVIANGLELLGVSAPSEM